MATAKKTWNNRVLEKRRKAQSVAKDLEELQDRVRAHRMMRYGDPPSGPFFATDTILYEAAGLDR